jgi:hypothetical protein
LRQAVARRRRANARLSPQVYHDDNQAAAKKRKRRKGDLFFGLLRLFAAKQTNRRLRVTEDLRLEAAATEPAGCRRYFYRNLDGNNPRCPARRDGRAVCNRPGSVDRTYPGG